MLKLDPETEAAQAAADQAIEQARADEREACLDILRHFDRTGREWVRGSLWANIFADAIARIEARGAPAADPLPEWRCARCGVAYTAALEPERCTECDSDRIERYVQRRRAADHG